MSPGGKKLYINNSRENREFIHKSVKLGKFRDEAKPASVFSTVVKSKTERQTD